MHIIFRFKYVACIAIAICSQVWQGIRWMLPTLIAPLAHMYLKSKDYLQPLDEPTLLESEVLSPLQETRYCQLLCWPYYYLFLTWHQKKSLAQLIKFILQPCTTCALLLACIDPWRNNSPPEYSWYLKVFRELRLSLHPVEPAHPLLSRLRVSSKNVSLDSHTLNLAKCCGPLAARHCSAFCELVSS